MSKIKTPIEIYKEVKAKMDEAQCYNLETFANELHEAYCNQFESKKDILINFINWYQNEPIETISNETVIDIYLQASSSPLKLNSNTELTLPPEAGAIEYTPVVNESTLPDCLKTNPMRAYFGKYTLSKKGKNCVVEIGSEEALDNYLNYFGLRPYNRITQYARLVDHTERELYKNSNTFIFFNEIYLQICNDNEKMRDFYRILTRLFMVTKTNNNFIAIFYSKNYPLPIYLYEMIDAQFAI